VFWVGVIFVIGWDTSFSARGQILSFGSSFWFEYFLCYVLDLYQATVSDVFLGLEGN